MPNKPDNSADKPRTLSPQTRNRLKSIIGRERTRWKTNALIHAAEQAQTDEGVDLVTRAIPRRNATNVLPLSFAQEQLWFAEQMEPGTSAYNIARALRLKGPLNVAALKASFTEIVRRHDPLRTRFVAIDNEPVQVIDAPSEFVLSLIDLTQLVPDAREAKALDLSNEEANRPFDLSSAPLFRAVLLKLEAQRHLLILNIHHIISDGWSWGVFFRELAILYRAFLNGHASPLADLPIQYADFAAWQRERLQSGGYERQMTYWRQRLAGSTALRLPTDRPRPPVQSFRGAAHTVLLSGALSAGLKALSQREGVTLFMTLLAAFQVLLARYAKQDDIVVGTDVANRDQVETEGLIGFFITHVMLRTDLSGNPTFRELLKRVREVALGAYAHQDVPFGKLVEALRPERSLSHTPLFQVLFVLQNYPIEIPDLPDLAVSRVDLDTQTSKFDLGVFMEETGPGIVGRWVYKTDLFDAATIVRMAGHFETLLSNIVTNPDALLNSFEMLTEIERRQGDMEREERRDAQVKKLRSARRKPIDLSQVREIKTSYLTEKLPLVIEPELDIDLADWAAHNRLFVETELSKHGGILFRGFDVVSAADFERFASALCPKLFGEYGDLPREEVGGKVYGSTPYPADQAILFHNESSHLHQWPMKIWFFCVKSAEQGGDTPIIDCRKIYQLLDPRLRQRFLEKKLMYVRNYVDGLDVDWRTFFHTNERSVVENYCRNVGIDFEWKAGTLRTRQIAHAVVKHPHTGEMVFFNQLQLHHISCLEPATRESLLSVFREDELPRNVYYGDGSPIENSVMAEINALYREIAVSFPWRERDILMLNNMLIAHGRYPYAGARKIVVAMGEMFSNKDLSPVKGMI